MTADGPVPDVAPHPAPRGERAPLDALLHPRSIAVLGASDNPLKLSGAPSTCSSGTASRAAYCRSTPAGTPSRASRRTPRSTPSTATSTWP